MKLDVRIVGFRGDYYDLSEQGKKKVRNLIYPVPNPEFPFLGVHFTRMTDGTLNVDLMLFLHLKERVMEKQTST